MGDLINRAKGSYFPLIWKKTELICDSFCWAAATRWISLPAAEQIAHLQAKRDFHPGSSSEFPYLWGCSDCKGLWEVQAPAQSSLSFGRRIFGDLQVWRYHNLSLKYPWREILLWPLSWALCLQKLPKMSWKQVVVKGIFSDFLRFWDFLLKSWLL